MHLRYQFSVFTLAAAVTATAGLAQPSTVLVPLDKPTKIELTAPIAPVFAQPVHGSLAFTGEYLEYTPAESFWEVGTDHVVYLPFGSNTTPVHIFLVAEDGPIVRFDHDFDTSIEVNPDLLMDGDVSRASLDVSSAFEGENGLSLAPGSGRVFADLSDGSPGGGNHGSGGHGGVDPPWPPGGLTLDEDFGVRVMSFGHLDEVEVRMRMAVNGYELMVRHTEDPGVSDPSHLWTPIGTGPRFLELRLWNAPRDEITGTVEAGYQFRIDGQVIEHRNDIDTNLWPDPTMRIGLIDLQPSDSMSLGIDVVEAWRPYFGAGHTLILGEAFEGGMPVLPSIVQVGSPWVAPGPFGTEASLFADVGNGPAYLRETSVSGPKSVGSRFVVRSADVTIGSSALVKLANFRATNGGGSSRLALWLERVSGVDQVFLTAKDDNGVIKTSPKAAIDPAGQQIELLWRRAEGAGKAIGRAELRLDGDIAAALEGLDNDTQSVESVSVGVVSVVGTLSGALVFDDLMIWQNP